MGFEKKPGTTELIPKHEASIYLQKVPNLSQTELRDVIFLSNKVGADKLSNAFLAVHQIMERQQDPGSSQRVYSGLAKSNLETYDRTRERLLQEGVKIEDVTIDDIRAGELLPHIVQMSREAYIEKLKREVEDEVRNEHDLLTTKFQELMQEIRSSLDQAEYTKLLSLLHVQEQNNELVPVQTDQETFEAVRAKLQQIGRRLSADWREVVNLNPFADRELHKEMKEAGVEQDPVLEKITLKLEEVVRVKALVANIRQETASPLSVKNAVEEMLSDHSEINPFLKRKIDRLLKQQPFPYKEVADTMEQIFFSA